MRIAITRDVSPSIGRCELTHLTREPIDVDLARVQHRRYEATLAALGCEVHSLPAAPDLPDAVFVEDVAVVVDEVAIIARPGAPSRRPEVQAVAEALKFYRTLAYIDAPGTLDGGDVLRIGKRVWVGLSGRSNRAAIDQMRAALVPLGYTVEGVPVTGCLHLKSAVTQVAEDAVLVNPAWIDGALFDGMDVIAVDPAEAYGANALLIGSNVIYPTTYPRTRVRLERRGILVRAVDVSELIKAEGAVTCCSLIFDAARQKSDATDGVATST
jgi:dimethylargininase